MERAAYHRPGTENFEVAARFLENLCTANLMNCDIWWKGFGVLWNLMAKLKKS